MASVSGDNVKMRYLQYILFMVAIVAYAWNEKRTEQIHQQFFNDMRTFANKGGRFTCADGNEIRKYVGMEEKTCEDPRPQNQDS